VRRIALVVVAAFALAGCGSSSHSSTTNATAEAQAEIRSAYQKFFSPQTSLSDRVAVLQNGSQFKSVVQAFASNPLASKVNVTVSSVKLEGQDKAKVVYILKLGSAGLPKQTGTAVRQNGTWKVGYASLCKLVALNGSAPPACAP
jgi:hypothetical protein